MAHAIYSELRRRAGYFIDFHTTLTPDTRSALFPNTPGEVGRKAEGMAHAFGRRSTLPAPMEILGGTAMMAATRDGIPSLIGSRVCARQRGLRRLRGPPALPRARTATALRHPRRAAHPQHRGVPGQAAHERFEGFAGGGLNRCFPDHPDGTLTEQMAHAIYTKLRAHANYFVGLHTAMTADVRWALFRRARPAPSASRAPYPRRWTSWPARG